MSQAQVEMNNGGWVKVWRKLLDWPPWVAMTAPRRVTTVTMLLMANWRDEIRYDVVSRKPITVHRGSFVATQDDIAKKAGVGRQVVRDTEAILTSDHGDGGEHPFITVSGTASGTAAGRTYTIVNYAHYQDEPGDGTTPGTKGEPPGEPKENQRRTAFYMKKDEEGEEGEEEKKCRRKAPTPELPGTDWYGWKIISTWMPEVPGLREPKDQDRVRPRWIAALRKLEKSHGAPAVEELIGWVRSQTNYISSAVRCPQKLLTLDKDGTRWWDRLIGEKAKPSRGQSRQLFADEPDPAGFPRSHEEAAAMSRELGMEIIFAGEEP